MKSFFKVFYIFIFVILALVFLYEFFYIQKKPAIYYLEKAVTKIHDSDKTFRVYYYFNALEFTNDPYLKTTNALTLIGESESFDCNYLLLTKEGLFVNKNSNYFETHIASLCIIISDDLNLKELNRGYRFIKKHFKFQYLFVTSKKYLFDNYDLHMKLPLKLDMKNYSSQEFQDTLSILQGRKRN